MRTHHNWRETVNVQEQYKLSILLKLLTLPILTSPIALEGVPVGYQELS